MPNLFDALDGAVLFIGPALPKGSAILDAFFSIGTEAEPVSET